MQPNRRKHDRYRVAIVAEMEIEGDNLIGETRDISLGGISVIIDTQVEEKRTADLALILTQDGIEDPNEEPFEVSARIIWTAPSDTGKHIVGLRFDNLQDSQTAHLQRFIDAIST